MFDHDEMSITINGEEYFFHKVDIGSSPLLSHHLALLVRVVPDYKLYGWQLFEMRVYC